MTFRPSDPLSLRWRTVNEANEKDSCSCRNNPEKLILLLHKCIWVQANFIPQFFSHEETTERCQRVLFYASYLIKLSASRPYSLDDEMINEYEAVGWTGIEKKTEVFRDTCPSTTPPTANPTWLDLWSNPAWGGVGNGDSSHGDEKCHNLHCLKHNCIVLFQECGNYEFRVLPDLFVFAEEIVN